MFIGDLSSFEESTGRDNRGMRMTHLHPQCHYRSHSSILKSTERNINLIDNINTDKVAHIVNAKIDIALEINTANELNLTVIQLHQNGYTFRQTFKVLSQPYSSSHFPTLF